MDEIKTLDEHLVYVEKMARLCFFSARRWFAHKVPQKKLSQIIKDHTPLLYHALNFLDRETGWDNPECNDILARADASAELPPEDFEETLWLYVRDLAFKRARENFHNAVGVAAPPNWHCGSLTYDPPKTPGCCFFHIANAIAPHSIFEDPDYLPACFNLLMKETELRYGAHTLVTGTWLNDRTRWRNLFPEEWLRNMDPREEAPVPAWHFGCWGQIVDRRGCINPDMDTFVRTHGYLKYNHRRSFCSFKALREKLGL